MKDFVPKGTGNSRFLKSVSNFLSLYPDYPRFAQALIAGTLPVDFNGINSEGVQQMGTGLNKATLLTDATAAALELPQADPTVNDALYAISQKTQPAQVNVLTTKGTVVTMTKGSKTLSATAGNDGWATLYPAEFGDWTIKAGSTSKVFNVNAIAVFYVAMVSLASLSWDVVASCAKKGAAKDMWNIGDKKTLTIDGTTYTAVIIGFDHDNVANAGSYGRSKAGITWQLLDCLNTTYRMNSLATNNGGWTSCTMRTSTMATLLGKLPTALKNNIVPVTKLTSAGDQSTTINSTTDSLFLLSEVEIFGAMTYSAAGEGVRYEYYAAGNGTIKKVKNLAYEWWERSPKVDYSAAFCLVYRDGFASNNRAGELGGVAFGFCV
jgi:hypothetical protein